MIAALAYAERGVHVFPCLPRSKEPNGALVPHGVKQATCDRAVIERWAKRSPDANIGIAIGVGALERARVLDIDPKNGGDAVFAGLLAKHGPMPHGPRQRTGSGGEHYMLGPWPSSDLRTKLISRDSGVELLGPGRYIVSAPSVHPDTGRMYEWLVSLVEPVPSPPPWLVVLAHRPAMTKTRELVPSSSAAASGALRHAREQIWSAPAGDRNNALNRAAFWIGGLVASGRIQEALAMRILGEAALAVGLNRIEVSKTIQSAFRSAARKAG